MITLFIVIVAAILVALGLRSLASANHRLLAILILIGLAWLYGASPP